MEADIKVMRLICAYLVQSTMAPPGFVCLGVFCCCFGAGRVELKTLLLK
jgi:hypothetical protein